ncbi:MAG: hypothetical protein ABTS22_19975, partial [Accumulibacter sp.]
LTQKTPEGKAMNARTALEIADKLDYWTRSIMSIHNVPTLPKLCDCGEKAADMLRQQHAEIERLTADLAESRRKSADLEISLQASRDMALRAYGADVCPNCDTALPKGCEGVFANDHDCMWRKT